MKQSHIIIGTVFAILILGGAFYTWKMPGQESISGENAVSTQKPIMETKDTETKEAQTLPRVTLHTNKGDVTLELFTDKTPITAGNFLKLSREGFYTETKFHRVIAGFMIQGGDPNSKGDNPALYGRGGPGYTIDDEFVAGLSNVRGTISMANTGAPRSGGSQFFINVADNIGLDYDKEPLASRHPVFGKVISGMDVVDAISKTKTGANDVPQEPVIIESIDIVE